MREVLDITDRPVAHALHPAVQDGVLAEHRRHIARVSRNIFWGGLRQGELGHGRGGGGGVVDLVKLKRTAAETRCKAWNGLTYSKGSFVHCTNAKIKYTVELRI